MTDQITASRPKDPIDAFARVAAADETARVARAAVVERKQPADLAEILERVLNTGIVIAGEIRVDLLDIELLTIKIRLVVTSLDRAEEVGLDWWRNDPWYSGRREVAEADSNQFIEAGSNRSASGDDADSTDIDRTASGGQSGSDGSGRSVYAEEVVAVSSSVAEPSSQRSSSSRKKPAAKQAATKKKTATKKSPAKKKTATKKVAANKRAAKKAAAERRAGSESS